MDLQQLATAASQHFADARPLIPMYIHIIVAALFPIYTGAHASLSRPSSAAKPTKKQRKDGDAADEEEDEDEGVQKMEGLTPKDAIIFPITAATALTGLYFLIKRYGASLINLTLGWYFAAMGTISVAKLVNDGTNLLITFLLPTYFGHEGRLWKAVDNKQYVAQDGSKETTTSPVPGSTYFTNKSHQWDTIWTLRAAVKQKYTTKAYIHEFLNFKANLTPISFLSVLFACTSIAYAYLVAKPWWLTNLQGTAVCYSGLQIMSPTTFPTGSLILGGLFFYDIWAVFFTPLMVMVATNLDQPIKLVFPRPDRPSATAGEPPVKSYGMLGLGDIVLPGIMIGLALRFDLYMFYLRKQQRRSVANNDTSGIKDEVIKAPYVPVTCTWGDCFWTANLPVSIRPKKLSASFPKPYFMASMVGYVMGMLTTLGVMSVWQHAQPALLYLVPGVLISLWGTGLVRGELKEMWQFSEAVTGEQLAEESEKEESEKGKDEKKADERSLFAKLWDETFGSSDDKTSKKDDDTDHIALSGDSKKSAKDGVKDDKPKAQNDGTLVAISVKRYKPRTATPTDKSLEKPSPAKSTLTPSDSSLEDAVLVNSADT
ncbi:hypothetical protein LTR08_008162 [Meristemomyces frigidus]|nr:hypothetical protein LTR08_008162 [Meristemomyces frigidus]